MQLTAYSHDSGLCAADAATRARFARDLRNLTLASPSVNRHQKSGKDAGEWVPDRNRCWFAGRVVQVRRAYGLTIDRREAAALERILSGCGSTALEPIVCSVPPSSGAGAPSASAGGDDAARALRRQREREDYLRGGAPARDCTGAEVPSGVSVHAGWGRGRGCLRVMRPCVDSPLFALGDARAMSQSVYCTFWTLECVTWWLGRTDKCWETITANALPRPHLWEPLAPVPTALSSPRAAFLLVSSMQSCYEPPEIGPALLRIDQSSVGHLS